jgi:hypothetical protein
MDPNTALLIGSMLLFAGNIIVTLLGKNKDTLDRRKQISETNSNDADSIDKLTMAVDRLSDKVRDQENKLTVQDLKIEGLECELREFRYGVPLLLRQIKEECQSSPRWIPRSAQL